MINPQKFDTDLSCDLEPFGFVEDQRTIKTKNAGKIMLVSFGALNYLGHYSPEFGGVAVCHLKPDFFLAVKYIPWDAKARRVEFEKKYQELKDGHKNMTPSDVTDLFNLDDYVLPTKKKRMKEEYFLQVAELNKQKAQEAREKTARMEHIQKELLKNKNAILARDNFKARTPEEIRQYMKENGIEAQKAPKKIFTNDKPKEKKPHLHVVRKGDENPKQESKPQMFKGEELIPLDDEEEE